jgi:16S rRNA (uracil1498-N3)-methyltransferase
MSTPPLFFVDHLPAGGRVRLEGVEGRHAARVRRIGVGEAVLVADGLGAIADCVVVDLLADGLVLDVLDWRHVAAPDPYLVVVQALPKGDRAELAVELMTELGVDEIVPWTASRSVVQWREGRAEKALERWRRTAREAAKQSRRPRPPTITDPASTADVSQRIRSGAAFASHESSSESTAHREHRGTAAFEPSESVSDSPADPEHRGTAAFEPRESSSDSPADLEHRGTAAFEPSQSSSDSRADLEPRGHAAFVLHESASTPLADAPLPASGEVVVVVGPEGGVTDEELAELGEAGATAVRLGEPVLRTSTAGAAALAAISVRIGRWS